MPICDVLSNMGARNKLHRITNKNIVVHLSSKISLSLPSSITTVAFSACYHLSGAQYIYKLFTDHLCIAISLSILENSTLSIDFVNVLKTILGLK